MLSSPIGVAHHACCTPKIRLFSDTLVLASFLKILKSREISLVKLYSFQPLNSLRHHFPTLTLTLNLLLTLTLLLTGVHLTLTVTRALTLLLTPRILNTRMSSLRYGVPYVMSNTQHTKYSRHQHQHIQHIQHHLTHKSQIPQYLHINYPTILNTQYSIKHFFCSVFKDDKYQTESLRRYRRLTRTYF